MKTYRIYFSQVVTQREFNRVYIEADSEEEALKKLKKYEYMDFEILDTDGIDAGEFEDIEINEILS